MRLLLVAIGLGLVLVIPGCSKPEEPVRVGVLVWPPYELAYLASEKGYIDSERIELIDFLSPAEMVRSYRFELIDAMFVTSQFSLINADRLVDSKIIYVIDFSAGGDGLIAQPEIDSIAELKGKRVGMEAGPLGAYTLERALAGSGMTRADVNLVFLDTPDQKIAFERGEVDAVATYEPTRSQLLKQGATELFNSREIPLEIIDVILAKEPAIQAHRDDFANLLKGIDKAIRDFRENPKEAAAIMVQRENLTVPEFLMAMQGVHIADLEENRELLTGDDQRLVKGLKKQCNVMQNAGILEHQPAIMNLIDTSVIETIEP